MSTAFFGIIDLLGILPYYLEIALGQDTVSIWQCLHVCVPDLCSQRFSGSQSSGPSGCYAYSDRSGTIILYCCKPLFSSTIFSTHDSTRLVQNYRSHVSFVPKIRARLARARVLRGHGSCSLQYPTVSPSPMLRPILTACLGISQNAAPGTKPWDYS